MSNTFYRDPQPRIQYVGDGARTSFEFPFPISADDDLLVYLGTQAATGFSITGLGDPTATVTFAQPPAPGSAVTLLRRTEGIRETEFVDGGPLRAATINAELDRIMMLIQENREEHGRAIRAHAFEGNLDFCLPPVMQRANGLLGFDSSGEPMVFGKAELPQDDGGGMLVTPAGGATARALGEHLATTVNVRDFGAIGDGVADDSAAFQAAIAAAGPRKRLVYVPASSSAYLIGTGLVLDGVALVGDGPGSIVQLSLATGFGLKLTGDSRICGLRVLGPGAGAWPQNATEVSLGSILLDGILIDGAANRAILYDVEVAACHTGLAIEGRVGAIAQCAFAYCLNAAELRAGATGAVEITSTRFRACSSGVRTVANALIDRLSLSGGEASRCGRGIELEAATEGRRVVEMSNVGLSENLEVDVTAGPRHSIAIRGCTLDASGRQGGVGLDLTSAGETDLAPTLLIENTRADETLVSNVQLSGGSNLDLLLPGDLIVLSNDVDDIDDHWTVLKASRAGIVHDVINQTSASAEIMVARVAGRQLLQNGDEVRIVGRSGIATLDSVGASTPSTAFSWLRADNHSRVFATQNPMRENQIELVGSDADLRYFPGLNDEPVGISGVHLSKGAVNGALTRLVTLEVEQDSAVSFAPDSTIGMVHVFGHSALGDPTASVFSYRADALGYTELVAAVNSVEVMQSTALTGTTGSPNVFTFSAHTDGKIYIENRLAGPTRTLSLLVIGAPL